MAIMISLPQKISVFSWRWIGYLFAISVSFIVLSLYQSGRTSLVHKSFYNLVFVVDNTPTEPKSLLPSFVTTSCNESCFDSNPIELSISCDLNQALLKVFMYDLPPGFHFGLLGWIGNANQIWPNVSGIPKYPTHLVMQHSMEYWLTLDLLSSVSPNITRRPSTAIRVQNSTQADVIFVPFFSSWSYNWHCKIHLNDEKNMDRILQEKLIDYLKGKDEWKRSGGKDHLIIAHHPNSLLVARRFLHSAIFLLSDFGRYPNWIANRDKDIIAPYKHIVTKLNATNSPSFEDRHVLVYFQGGIHRKDGGKIRKTLYDLLKDEKDVYFKDGKPTSDGVRTASAGMASSKFCLSIAGDTPSSNRLFDAIVTHCVPVIVSDDIELPFEDVLDYSKFTIFVRASDAAKKGHLIRLLRRFKREKWIKMWKILKEIAPHFEYQHPSRPCDAVDMIWQAVHRKIFSLPSKVPRRKRYQKSPRYQNK